MIVDFALIMFVALLATGLIWALDAAVLAPRRATRHAALVAQGADGAVLERSARQPIVVEYARAFFPVILIVFLLRSFLVEPFRIPSGSMLPSLLVGDFILVNKFTYGVRLPILNKKIVSLNEPQRGDVMVFRFPDNPSDNYIKRVVGLPGDRIGYRDKQLFINGKAMRREPALSTSDAGDRFMGAKQYVEDLDGAKHAILLSPNVQQEPMEFVVPTGQYFVMGDNRDHSNDSRYWGTVPDENVVGKAFLVWFSWDHSGSGGVNWRRIGSAIE